jgi:hypothetical protein
VILTMLRRNWRSRVVRDYRGVLGPQVPGMQGGEDSTNARNKAIRGQAFPNITAGGRRGGKVGWHGGGSTSQERHLHEVTANSYVCVESAAGACESGSRNEAP